MSPEPTSKRRATTPRKRPAKKSAGDAAVVRLRAQLRDVRLLGSHIRLKEPTADAASFTLNIEPSVSAPLEHEDGEASGFVVMCQYKFRALEEAVKNDTAGTEIAEVDFTYAALYSLEQGAVANMADLKAFTKTDGANVIHPYARQYLHSVVLELGMPPLVIDFGKHSMLEPKSIDSSST